MVQASPAPPDETRRLHDVRRSGALELSGDPRLTYLARVIARDLGLWRLAITIIGETHVYTAAATGPEREPMPRALSVAEGVLKNDTPIALASGRAEPRLREHPLLAEQDRGIVAAPLHSPSGQTIGALVGFLDNAGAIPDALPEALREAAWLVEGEIRAHAIRRGLEALLTPEVEGAAERVRTAAEAIGRDASATARLFDAERARVLGRKWALPILDALARAPQGFNELFAAMNGISTRTLSDRLQELEHASLLERIAMGARSKYQLTPTGERLHGIVSELFAANEKRPDEKGSA